MPIPEPVNLKRSYKIPMGRPPELTKQRRSADRKTSDQFTSDSSAGHGHTSYPTSRDQTRLADVSKSTKQINQWIVMPFGDIIVVGRTFQKHANNLREALRHLPET